MAAISTATYLAIASAAVTAYGAYQTSQSQKAAGEAAMTAAEHQKRVADRQAEAQEQEAGQIRASSQRAAVEEKRKAGIVGASAKARIAASGGAIDSPDLINTVAGIDQGGEYEALTALYEGEERGRGLEHGAAITRSGGAGALYAGQAERNMRRSAARSAYTQAAGQAASAYRESRYFDREDERRALRGFG